MYRQKRNCGPLLTPLPCHLLILSWTMISHAWSTLSYYGSHQGLVTIEGIFKRQRIPPLIGRPGKDTSRLVVQIKTKSGIPGSKIIT